MNSVMITIYNVGEMDPPYASRRCIDKSCYQM